MSTAMPPDPDAAEQARLAETGRAVGQCAHCGSYRADGRPPVLHDVGCPQWGDHAGADARIAEYYPKEKA